MTRNTTNAKRNATSNETPSIVLKTIHNDIMRDNANATITTKQMRAKLRIVMNDVHVRNSSWIFTTSQYDIVRSMFDDAYRAKIERAQKRATKSNATPRKRNVKSRDVVAHDATNDATNVDTNVDA